MLFLPATVMAAALLMTTGDDGATWLMRPGCESEGGAVMVTLIECRGTALAAARRPEETSVLPAATVPSVVRLDNPGRLPMGTCYDSDGGDFPNTAGYVIDAFGGGPFVDRCSASLSAVWETVCNPSSGNANQIEHGCPNGCGTTVIAVAGHGNYVCAYCKP